MPSKMINVALTICVLAMAYRLHVVTAERYCHDLVADSRAANDYAMDKLDELEAEADAAIAASGICQTVDVTANLTAERYLEHMNHAWLCEDDAAGCGSCSKDAVLDDILRDTCGWGWKQSNDQWAYWQSQAERCENKLEHRVGRKMSRPDHWSGVYR